MSDARLRPRLAPGLANEPMQHLGDLVIFVTPRRPSELVDIAEVQAITRPDPHLIRRTQRHPKKAPEFGSRQRLLAKPFRQIGANGFAAPTDLIRQGALL